MIAASCAVISRSGTLRENVLSAAAPQHQDELVDQHRHGQDVDRGASDANRFYWEAAAYASRTQAGTSGSGVVLIPLVFAQR